MKGRFILAAGVVVALALVSVLTTCMFYGGLIYFTVWVLEHFGIL